MAERFTQEEIEIARSVDLTAVASHLGYTVQRIGRYHTLKEMDSIRIYDRRNWCRFSRRYEKGENGGSQIDFLRVFEGISVGDAIRWLLDFAGYQRANDSLSQKEDVHKHIVKAKPVTEEVKEFILPDRAVDDKRAIWYLTGVRGISRMVVEHFVSKGLLFETKQYHNVVFIGTDRDGNVRFASMRGTDDSDGKRFRCDVRGSDKNYGFNLVNEESDELYVFEAAIDMLSFATLEDNLHSNMIALGMLADKPLIRFLEEHPNIRSIKFCLDNDEPGRNATSYLLERYECMGYEVTDYPATVGKDYNDMLLWTIETEKQRKGR